MVQRCTFWHRTRSIDWDVVWLVTIAVLAAGLVVGLIVLFGSPTSHLGDMILM